MKISLSGASCGGKTTILKSLNGKYNTLPDSGMIAINNYLVKNSAEEFLKWRVNNTRQYYEKIIKHQILVEKKQTISSVTLFDRTVLDYIALMSLEEGVELKNYVEYYSLIDIDYVFIFFPLPTFNSREDTGRLLNKFQSKKIAEKSIEICKGNNIDYSIIPLTSRTEQLKYINEIIYCLINEYRR